MRLTVEDCCQSLGFEPGQGLEASLKQELEEFIAEDTQTQLRDANIDQRSERHKLAVQTFLDQHGSRFWPDTDKDRTGLLHDAPIFPRDSKLITRMISNMLAYKLRRYKAKDKPETPEDPPMKSDWGSPVPSSVTDSDEGPQDSIDDDLEEDLEGAATPGYDPETGSQNDALGIQESIETDDPGVLPAADAPLSPAFGSPSRQTVTYYSPPTRTRAGGDFGPSGLTPRMAAKTLLWVKTSECCYAKRAYLGSCMNPMQFVDTILGLWDIQGNLNALRSVTYKVEGAPWPVLMSDDIVSGHEDMMGEIGAWWERSVQHKDLEELNSPQKPLTTSLNYSNTTTSIILQRYSSRSYQLANWKTSLPFEVLVFTVEKCLRGRPNGPQNRSERTKVQNLAQDVEAEPAPGFLYRTVVQVLVGPDENRFDVHKELLCSVSDFFSAALDGGFEEAQTGAVKLPEQDVKTFQYFVHWLYTGKLTGFFRPRSSPSTKELSEAMIAKRKVYRRTKAPMDAMAAEDSLYALHQAIFEDAPIRDLVSIYLLADVLQVRGLRDHIINLMVKVYGTNDSRIKAFWGPTELLGNLPEPTMIMNHAYERLSSTSNLRRFIVDFYLSHVDQEAIILNRDLLSPDFVFDCLLASHTGWVNEDPRKKFHEASIICQYHEHDAECWLTSKGLSDTKLRYW